MKFMHTSGKENLADYCTRPTSPKLLSVSNFHRGPSHTLENLSDDLVISLPNPGVLKVDEITNMESPGISSPNNGIGSFTCVGGKGEKLTSTSHIVPIENYSS